MQQSLSSFARANGWTGLLSRVGPSLQRRVRDGLLARQLGAPGFRAGRAPRVLGLRHMRIGPDFHAGDALWLESVTLYLGQSFEPRLQIGPHTRLSDRVHIACLREITIGAHLLCGSGVLISDHTHGRYDTGRDDTGADTSDPAVPPAERPLYSAAPVRVGDNVWLGDGVAVLAGAVLGEGCVIGANSVVTGTIPSRTLAVGAPARPVRRWDEATRGWVPLRPAAASAAPGLID